MVLSQRIVVMEVSTVMVTATDTVMVMVTDMDLKHILLIILMMEFPIKKVFLDA